MLVFSNFSPNNLSLIDHADSPWDRQSPWSGKAIKVTVSGLPIMRLGCLIEVRTFPPR